MFVVLILKLLSPGGLSHSLIKKPSYLGHVFGFLKADSSDHICCCPSVHLLREGGSISLQMCIMQL